MEYKESELVELKRELDDDMKSEIIAFLNSYLGGTIFVGIEDDGNLSNLTQEQIDENESKVINWIRDEAIYPNCSEYVNIKTNEDGVLAIEIQSGKGKPYYLKSKGLKPSGVYVRYGRNKAQATQEEISRMVRERDNIRYESLISLNQDLTFKSLEYKFIEQGLDFNEFKMKTSGFTNPKTNEFTNLALWFSDQYDVETKIASYQGLDRDIFRLKKEFSGSIVNQIDKTLEYFEFCNETRIVINGKPTRTEIPSYNLRSAREAILNCYCHKDFSRSSNIKVEFFDDRCEIISPGGFYDGLTLEQALDGLQSFRNPNLVKLLFKLDYIENYASGLSRIFKEYKKINLEPTIKTTIAMFKLTLPNRNYEALYLHPEQHIKDNSDITFNDKLSSELVTDTNDKSDNVIVTLNKRDSNIYKTIQSHPGLNYTQLEEFLLILDPTITRDAFQKRIKALSNLIEFRGAKRNGGYYIIKG